MGLFVWEVSWEVFCYCQLRSPCLASLHKNIIISFALIYQEGLCNVKDHDKKLLQQKEILCQSVSNCVKASVSNVGRCGATGEVFRQKCSNKRKHLPNLAKFVAFTSNPRLKLFVGIRQKIFTFSSIFVC